LSALSDALAAVRDQLAGQSSALGDLKTADTELRRLLADKAGFADVQAVLQAHSAPNLVPVSPWPLKFIPSFFLTLVLSP